MKRLNARETEKRNAQRGYSLFQVAYKAPYGTDTQGVWAATAKDAAEYIGKIGGREVVGVSTDTRVSK